METEKLGKRQRKLDHFKESAWYRLLKIIYVFSIIILMLVGGGIAWTTSWSTYGPHQECQYTQPSSNLGTPLNFGNGNYAYPTLPPLHQTPPSCERIGSTLKGTETSLFWVLIVLVIAYEMMAIIRSIVLYVISGVWEYRFISKDKGK
jgi:hypothetical protein